MKMHSLPYLEDSNIGGVNLFQALLEDVELFWRVWGQLGHKFDKNFKSLFESMTK